MCIYVALRPAPLSSRRWRGRRRRNGCPLMRSLRMSMIRSPSISKSSMKLSWSISLSSETSIPFSRSLTRPRSLLTLY